MSDLFERRISEFLMLYNINHLFDNFRFTSSSGSYNYYEFNIYGRMYRSAFDEVNQTTKDIEFILRGNTPYIKVLNVPQINVMGAFEALMKLSRYILPNW